MLGARLAHVISEMVFCKNLEYSLAKPVFKSPKKVVYTVLSCIIHWEVRALNADWVKAVVYRIP